MAVPTTQLEIRYDGNGSTTETYPIPFPFLDPAHIYAAVSSDGVAEAVLLPPSAYRVTPPSGGTGGALTTNSAVVAPATITIFREVPLTQPTVFQPTGPFPAKSNETALDRLLMQVQQISRRLSLLGAPSMSGQGDSDRSVLTWATSADRGAVKPGWPGQLGVELSTQTLWIAQDNTAGAWQEFQPRRANRLVLGFTADAGSPGADQSAVADLFQDWEIDAALFGGDNNYNGADQFDADWAAFNSWIATGNAWPALGNHDMDNEGWEDRYRAKFPYLPRERYYQVTLGGGLVDLFVLNSGRDSVWELTEPDGNSASSSQHEWFVHALAQSRARWKIVMFHHPPASLTDDTNGRIEPEMAWPEFAQADLVLCGHAHLSEALKWNNVALWNLSSVVFVNGTAGGTIQGGSSVDVPLWADDVTRCAGRIVASEEKLTVEAWSIGLPYGGARALHIRDARDFLRAPRIVENFRVYDEAIPAAETVYVHTVAAPMMLREVEVSCATSDADDTLAWSLFGGVVLLASGGIAGGELRGTAPCEVPDTLIPAGTILTLEQSHSAPSDRTGLEVALSFERHS